MIAAVVAAAAAAAAEPVASRLLAARRGTIVSIAEDGRATRIAGGADAAWSPDGTLVVLVRQGDLRLANADGSGERSLTRTPAVRESEPVWRPDGRAVVYTAQIDGARQIRLLDVVARTSRRIAASAAEEWSAAFTPDGRRIAFVTTRTGAAQIATGRADGTDAATFRAPDPASNDQPLAYRDLAWSHDGTRLAYTADALGGTGVYLDDGTTQTLVGAGSRPVWSPDGARLAVSDAAGIVAIVESAGGEPVGAKGAEVPLDWRVIPRGRPRFPDLSQRPPTGLVVTSAGGRWTLGFTSLVDNRGPGVLWIKGVRPRGRRIMTVAQLVELDGGGVRRVRDAGVLRYTVAPPHYHWHWLGFDRYELRRAGDFQLVVRDRKTGFCIADHYGHAPGIPHGPPRFRGDCAQFNRRARVVEEGSSVGYTDRYPAHFHGQRLDLMGVRAGRYWLVHRANPDFRLREARYDNNAASLLVRITWPNGRRTAPRVVALRGCRRERC